MPEERFITVKVLDHLSVTAGSAAVKLSPVERNLVALLAAAGPDGLDTERLADGLWVDRLPASWSASLRNSISRLNTKVAAVHPDSAKLISERSPVRRLEVDREAVDLWRLLGWAADPAIEDEPGLLLGTPFPGCELPPLLRRVSEDVVAARQDVVARWEAEGEALPNQVLAAVRRLCADDPFNQTFIYSAVRLHLVSNHLDGARRILDEAEEELSDLGVELSEELVACRGQLEQQRPITPVGEPGPVSSPPLHSPAIQRLAERPLVGRSELLSQIMDRRDTRSGGIMLHGHPGAGKTRLAAEVAVRLEEAGFHSAYMVANQDLSGSLQPFLDSFRGLREVVKPYLDRLNEPETNTRSRTEMIEYFERTYAGRPLCLLADDVQWFDAQSRSLLLSLCRATLDIDVFLIATGRVRDSSASWTGWMADLGRAGVVDIPVRALDRDAMEELIGQRIPDATRVQSSQLSERLLELSSGIPEVADWLLDRVDGTSLEIATDDVDGTGYDALISTLSDDVRYCGAVGALLGIRFNQADLCELSGLSELDTGRYLQTLIDLGLLLELPMPDEYRFLHVLAAEALRQTLSAQDQVELHARAFTLFSDTHRRAWHGSKSVPLTSPVDAASALVTSARLSYAEGDFPATSRNMEQAIELSRETVSLGDQVINLEALERGGVRPSTKRMLVTRTALDLGDHRSAVAAATSGLPDTEVLEGDPDRIAVLKMIDQDQLAKADRIHLNIQLSRQLVFAGRIEEAQRLADEVHEQAETPDQLARTWLAAQLPVGLGATTAQPQEMPWFDRVESTALMASINQARVINEIGAGRSKAAYSDIVSHARMTAEHGLPQLEWLAKLFQATALTDQGHREPAMAIAAEAYRLGLRAGLRSSGGTYETQHFIWRFHEGSHGQIHDMLTGDGPADITGNIIYDAASASVLFNHGMASEDEQALARAFDLVTRVGRKAASSAFDTAVIGMVADVIAADDSPELLRWARSRLESRHGSFLLLASAAANLGPVEGVSAKLAADRFEKQDLLQVAIDVADRHELALWQVIGRLNMATAVVDDVSWHRRLFSEVEELAVTPWLAQIAQNRGLSAF